MNHDVMKKFLYNTDETGRFVVTSQRTGKIYAVEPMGNPHIKWGDIDICDKDKKLTGNYGNKYKGSIDPKESLIMEENGFKNIKVLDKGTSPFSYIEELDSKYPDKVVDVSPEDVVELVGDKLYQSN